MNNYQCTTVLEDESLVIEERKDQSGNSYYVARSSKFYPYKASSRNILKCLFKFNLILGEQKRLASLIKI